MHLLLKLPRILASCVEENQKKSQNTEKLYRGYLFHSCGDGNGDGEN